MKRRHASQAVKYAAVSALGAVMPFVATPGAHAAEVVATEVQSDSASASTQRSGGQGERSTSASLEEIVVTAQRRKENLQNVPVAISAFSGNFLDEKGLDDLGQVARFTPGFSASSFTDAEPIFAVRGSTNTFSQGGTSKPVGVFLDDVYLSRNSSSAFDLYDLEQVAVLRGPQGTLFGRNVTGGAVMITTSRPSLEKTIAKAEVGYGNYNDLDLRGLVSVPLSSMVAAKLSTTYKTHDGYGSDRLTGRPQDDRKTFNVRGQLLVQPDDNLQMVFTADYSKDDNNDRTLSTVQPTTADDGDIRTSETGIDQYYHRKIYGLTGHIDWTADTGTLTSITAYRDSRSDEDYSFSSTAYTLIAGGFQREDHNIDHPKTFSQEIRWVSNISGPFSYVAGLYYYHEDISRRARQFRYLAQTGTTIFNQLYDETVKTESYAGYADLAYQLADTVKLDLSGRYTWEKKQAQVNFINGLNRAGDFQTPTFEDTYSQFTPRAVITWQPTDGVSVYGSYTQGFTAGGFNTEGSNASVIGQAFKPEKVDSFEIGAKTEFLDRHVRANVTAFHEKYTDKQEGYLDRTNFNFIITNAAKAKMQGIEVEVNIVPNEYLTLTGTYAYLDATYEDFNVPAGQFDYTGHYLGTSPENSFSVGADVQYPVGDFGNLFAGASYTWQDKYYTGAENRDTFLIDPYGLMNASIGLETADRRWRVTLWGQNLFNENYVLIRSDFGPVIGIGEHYGTPFTFGLRVSAKFN